MTKRDELTRMSVADVIATVDRIGGEELKANVKLRVGRGRRRRGKRSGAPVIAIVIGALVLVGGLIAILAGGGIGRPGPARRPADELADRDGPHAPRDRRARDDGRRTRAVETEAQRAAREADLKKKEAEARLRQSRAELEDATNFARLQWEDKGAVVQRYRRVGRSFGDTEAGKDAKKRAELIEKGEMHPHPDRVYAPKTTVDRAREAWETLRGQVDEAISAFRYDEAVRLVPTAVEDPEGRLADDVEFHRQVALDLVAFRSALDGALDAMKPEARDIRLEKGVARVQRVRSASISVEQAGAATELVWSDALVDEICALAKRAFVSKDPRTSVQLATFAWAHRRRGVFFQTAIALKTAMAMSGTEDPHLAKLLARATTRMPK